MVALLLFAAAAGLSAAGWLYAERLVRFDLAEPRLGHVFMGAATATIGLAAAMAFGADAADAPIRAGALVLMCVAFGLGAVGLVAQVAWKSALTGPVLAPIIGVVCVALALHIGLPEPTLPVGGVRAITILHVSLTIVGFILFIPAFVLSILYVGQVYRLKTKQAATKGLPSLVTLERSAWRLLYVGYPLYTAGILIGFVWQDTGEFHIHARQIFAALSWVIYGFAIWRRVRTGWRGARAAVALMTAFTVTLGAVLLYSLR